MTEAEVAAFRQEPHAEPAIRVRRFDDDAKSPTAQTPPFEYYLDTYVIPLVRTPEAAQ